MKKPEAETISRTTEMIVAYEGWDRRDAFENELDKLAHHHPDLSRRNLYAAYLELLTQRNEQLITFLTPFLVSLPKEKSLSHFLNLLVHTHIGEYIFLINKFGLGEKGLEPLAASVKHYADFSVEDWIIALDSLLNPNTSIQDGDVEVFPTNEASTELRERSTQTHQISRYLGPLIFLNEIGRNRNIRVADVGCSLGIALKAMQEGVKIPVEYAQVTQNADTELKLTYDKAYAYDIEDILDQQTIQWIFACCAYPKESETTYLQLLHDYMRLQPHPEDGIIYRTGAEGNMFELYKLGPNALDVIIINTTLYQLPQERVDQFLSIASKTLASAGWIIVSDFVHIEENKLVFGDSWFMSNGEKASKTYRTVAAQKSSEGHGLGEWKEIFQFENARCSNAYVGSDYLTVIADSKIELQPEQL